MRLGLETVSRPLSTDIAGQLADPTESANLYCAGRLCETLKQVVAPAWRESRARSEAYDIYLWVMRYARCGEHLKVRMHGPKPQAALWRAILEKCWTAYVDGLPPASNGAVRLSSLKVAPIDLEDHAGVEYPDRFLLRTKYQRSHVSLGYQPYLQDDVYTELLTRCLGSSTEVVLGLLKSGPDGRSPHKSQQTILLKSLIAGLSALPFSPADRDLYLLYHRDVLLRAFLRRKKVINSSSNMVSLVARFDAEIERLGDQVQQLASQARLHWQEGSLPPWGQPFAVWSQLLYALTEYVSPICRTAAYQIDPFAESPLFPPLFKAFHGLANQIGLDALNEAFAYHLLISLTGAEDLRRRPVLLRPNI
jgi:hypothetical protein